MSIEGGGDSPNKKFSSEQNRQRAESYSMRSGIIQDYTNAWAFLQYIMDRQVINELPTIRRYEEYFRDKEEEGEPKEVVDYLMSVSDPGAVAAIDSLVIEFNSDLDRIKREKDWGAVENFIAKMKKLMGRE